MHSRFLRCRSKDLSYAVVMVTSLFLGGCSSAVSRLQPLASDAPGPYLLGAGDTLQIVIFGETDLSGTYRISDSGMVAMPLVGLVAADGLSIDQFQKRLIERLQVTALKSPNVTISVNEYRPFFILGEVKTPGLYPYVPNMTVLTSVAIAGGFTDRASQNEISVSRQAGGKAIEARAWLESRVLPGDVVYVYERHF